MWPLGESTPHQALPGLKVQSGLGSRLFRFPGLAGSLSVPLRSQEYALVPVVVVADT